MKERPILFSGPMVRAILNGQKTQTRRICKPQPVADPKFLGGFYLPAKQADIAIGAPHVHEACRYGQPGDRLWVRETFVQGYDEDPETGMLQQYDEDGSRLPMKTWYRATGEIDWADDDGYEVPVPWRPSIHMPRALCRIVLEITGVRVERLQDISDADALAEGVDRTNTSIPGYACERFQTLWQSINGPESWAANPWVWVIEFKRIQP